MLIRFCKVLTLFLLCLPLLKQDILPNTLASRSGEVLGSRTITYRLTPVASAIPVKTRIKPTPTPTPTMRTRTRTDLVQTVFDLNLAVNEWRRARGRAPFATDDKVCKAVGERAREIAGDFSHDRFMDAVKRNSIDYKSVSENIAMNTQMSARAAVDQWDKSPSHHEAMLGDYNFGCGAISGNYAAFMFLKQ